MDFGKFTIPDLLSFGIRVICKILTEKEKGSQLYWHKERLRGDLDTIQLFPVHLISLWKYTCPVYCP